MTDDDIKDLIVKAVKKPAPIELAAMVLGPTFAAKGDMAPAEMARRLYELADAISSERKARVRKDSSAKRIKPDKSSSIRLEKKL